MPTFGDEVKLGNIQENWLFTLNNDNSGAVYLAFQDITYDGNFYHGAIINKPTIRDSIDLTKSTAKSGNISISIPDFDYQGSPISEELFGGSNHYINQTATVFSKINNDTPVQIGSFRLTDISSNGKTLSISLTSHRPWDFISFPQDKSDTNNYIPISYGNYTPNTCREGAFVVNDSLMLFPVPVDYVANQIQCISPRVLDGTSGNEGILHFWDKTAEQFCPLLTNAGTDYFKTISIQNNSINYVTAPINLHRAYMAKPIILKKDFTSGNYSAWSDLTDIGNAVDDRYVHPSTSTYTEITNNISLLGNSGDTNSVGEILFVNPLNFEGEAQVLNYTLTGGIFNVSQTGKAYLTSSGNVNYFFTFENMTGGTHIIQSLSTTSGNTTFVGDSQDTIITESTSDFKTSYNANKGFDEDDVRLVAGITIFDDNYIGTSTAQADFRVYDIAQTVRAKYESLEDKSSASIKTKKLFLGCNGEVTSWDSSDITNIHEAHLDMLIRYAGLTQSDGTAISDPTDEAEISGFSSLNKDWGIRWWQLEPKELKKTLEKLQYEGGFIFRYRADGTPHYITIGNSNTTDETLTKQDVKDLTINPTPFSELLTKMDISYEKHPAENRYITTQTSTNSTARTDWSIQTKENISQVNLDAYVSPVIPATAGDPDDDFYSYYDNIFGDIKTLVSGTIVNTKYYGLEVGDIIEFENMYPEKIFGESWSGKQYMITSLQRTIGTLKFEAREI